MTTTAPPLIVDTIRGPDGILMPVWLKGPDDVEDYGLGWSDHLASDDSIVAVTYTPNNPEISVLSKNYTDANTYFWATGAVTSDDDCLVAAHITTLKGRQHTRTFGLRGGRK